MTVQVGDKVRITREKTDLTVGMEYKAVYIDGGEIAVIDDVGDKHFLSSGFYELIKDTTITAQIRAKMEEHMSNGEYVRAVRWAQLAEQAEELENE